MRYLSHLLAAVCVVIAAAAPAHGWPGSQESPDPVPGVEPVMKLEGTFLAFGPQGKLVAAMSWPEMTVALWEPETKKRVREIKTGYTASIGESLGAFSPDGKLLAATSADGDLGVWEVASGRSLAKFPSSRRMHADYLAFAPDGDSLYAYDGESIRVYDAATWRLRQRLQLAVPHFSAALSPDGKLLAVCQASRVEILDARTTKPKRQLSAALESYGLEFSPDSKTLATRASSVVLRGIGDEVWRMATTGAAVTLWDVATGKEKRTLSGAHSYARFSPDGKLLVTGGPKGPIFWSTDGYSERAAINTPAFVYFSPDGKHILVEQRTFDGLRMYNRETVLTKLAPAKVSR